MPKTYKIRDGFSFVDADNKVKVGGDTVELDDDVATFHLHKLELVDTKAVKAAEKKAAASSENNASKQQ